jgi:hypothetical protein
MSNYIKAVITAATATAEEIVALIPTDNLATITSSGGTNLEFQYLGLIVNHAGGAYIATNLTLVIPAGSTTAANEAAGKKAVMKAQQNPGSVPYLFEPGPNGAAPQLITSVSIGHDAVT